MSDKRITVVTPSYNQAAFLPRTLASVLNQGYPNLEYIVIDGGSKDSSVDIINQYADRLAYWVSEKDAGQSNAINKGFARSSGEILCWLNSDDYFEPGTLRFVAEFFQQYPEVDVVCGAVNAVDPSGKIIETNPAVYHGRYRLAAFRNGYHMHQASIFWRRRVYEKIGPLREDLHLTMDFDYWLRMSRHFNIQAVPRVLSNATIHPLQKTADFSLYTQSQQNVVMEHFGSPLTLRDWPIRLGLYRYLFREAVQPLRSALRRLLPTRNHPN